MPQALQSTTPSHASSPAKPAATKRFGANRSTLPSAHHSLTSFFIRSPEFQSGKSSLILRDCFGFANPISEIRVGLEGKVGEASVLGVI